MLHVSRDLSALDWLEHKLFPAHHGSKDHSAYSFSIVPWVLVVSSYACDDQHSRPEAKPFIDLSEFSMQVSPLWYSALCFLATMAFLNSKLLSSQLREPSGLCLGSPLLCCSLEMLTKQKLGQLKGSFCFPSLKDHYPELTSSSCLKTIVSYIFSVYLLFQKRREAWPCYSNLA